MCTLTQIALVCAILVILVQGAVLYGLCMDLKRRDDGDNCYTAVETGVDPEEAELRAALKAVAHEHRQQQQSV